jgi:hypothetical protein
MSSVMASAFVARLRIGAPVFSEQHGCFQHAGRNFSGLLPTLNRIFYPGFKRKRTRFRKRGPDAPPMPVVTKARGIRVHSQLQAWCEMGSKPRDGLAKQIIESLTARNIRLIACEVPICDTENRVATAIDGIGEDEQGRVVVLEFKAGYQRGARGHGNLQTLPGVAVPSTPLNHATLQLAMTKAILGERYQIEADQHLLLISNGKGVTLRALPAWAKKVECAQMRRR